MTVDTLRSNVIYNLPNDSDIVLSPIVSGVRPDGSSGDVPAGVFVVNTSGPMNPPPCRRRQTPAVPVTPKTAAAGRPRAVGGARDADQAEIGYYEKQKSVIAEPLFQIEQYR